MEKHTYTTGLQLDEFVTNKLIQNVLNVCACTAIAMIVLLWVNDYAKRPMRNFIYFVFGLREDIVIPCICYVKIFNVIPISLIPVYKHTYFHKVKTKSNYITCVIIQSVKTLKWIISAYLTHASQHIKAPSHTIYTIVWIIFTLLFDYVTNVNLKSHMAIPKLTLTWHLKKTRISSSSIRRASTPILKGVTHTWTSYYSNIIFSPALYSLATCAQELCFTTLQEHHGQFSGECLFA